jgi:hypothetical protein
MLFRFEAVMVTTIKVLFFGMQYIAACIGLNVSEKYIVSIFRVK